MTYDMCKFERGQVWMVRFKHPESVGHEQAKDRPWLVLSIVKFNKSSRMVIQYMLLQEDNSRRESNFYYGL